MYTRAQDDVSLKSYRQNNFRRVRFYLVKNSLIKSAPHVTLFCGVCALTLIRACQLLFEESRAALYIQMHCDELVLLEIRTFGFGDKNNYRNEKYVCVVVTEDALFLTLVCKIL